MSRHIQFDNTVLGNSRFATPQELHNAGLLSNTGGVVFGRINNHLVEKPPELQGHCLIVGGTGTGKSRGIAIPTLLRWKGAVFAIDVKGELSDITAGHRQGKVYIFNPEGYGASYDPLQECKTVDGANELARSLIPEPQNGDPFWAKTAQAFLAAGALEGALTGSRFVDVIEKLCTTQPEQLIEGFQSSPHRSVRLLSSVGVGMPEKTLGGVFAELRSRILSLGADPNIERATSHSAWTPQCLEEGSTVYLKVSERMIKQYEGLWTVIVSQVLRYLSGRPERSEPPILILLDEFARLGKLPGILEALSTLRSRNVHIALFIQSMAQLDHIYSPAERKIIADNCGYKLVLSATDPETQKYFSDLSGQRTVWVGNQASGSGRNTSGGIGLIPGASSHDSRGLTQQGTPLIRPEEFARLPYPVLFALNLTCYVSKSYWDQDPDIAPIAGLNPVKPVKLYGRDPRPKRRRLGTLSLLLISLLPGFVLGVFLAQAILRYSLGSETLLKSVLGGTYSRSEVSEVEALRRAASDFGFMVKTIFSGGWSFVVFLRIWIYGSIPFFLALLLARSIFRKIAGRSRT